MLALAAGRLSSSDSWRCSNDDKKRSMLGSWRDRRDLNETGDEKTVRETKVCGEMKAKIENWRSRKQEKAKTLDEASIYGEDMPSEWMLQKLYKQLKINNNNFITWLVESVYPFTEALPPFITLSRKQAKGTTQRNQTVIENDLIHSSRPPQIRRHRQQLPPAGATHQQSITNHTRSPRPRHRRTKRVLLLDVAKVNGPTLPGLPPNPHILHRGPQRSPHHPSNAHRARINDITTTEPSLSHLRHTNRDPQHHSRQTQELSHQHSRSSAKQDGQDGEQHHNVKARLSERGQGCRRGTSTTTTTR